MVLVLGTPGSGCTTFLKAIANQRAEYAGIDGEVRYAGIDAQEMAKYYKGEVVYNEEDDLHIATLTVAQTLSFALSRLLARRTAFPVYPARTYSRRFCRCSSRCSTFNIR